MAHLHVLAESQGPNEKIAGEQLAKQLPEEWHVICGRQLPIKNRPEIDFIVIANNNLFILEEKSWGPKVIMQDLRWTVIKPGGNQERQNPTRGLSLKAKATRGWLENKVVGYKNTKGHRVHGFVFMTHKDLDLRIAPGLNMQDLVLKMDDFAIQLITFDKENRDEHFEVLRTDIFKLILDLPLRRHELRPIADYRILRQLDLNSMGLPNDRKILRFDAEHSTVGTEYQLKCYVRQYWANEDGIISTDFKRREVLVSERLREIGVRRTWDVLPPIEHIEMDWLVFPVRKPLGAISLNELRDTNENNLNAGVEPLSNSNEKQLAIVIDALQALEEIHNAKIIHKALTPDRVWVTRGNRIMFSDFYISHLEGELSIEITEEDNASKPFRAPECLKTISLADQSSDLYSLVLILFYAILGLEEPTTEACANFCKNRPESFWNTLLEILSEAREKRSDTKSLLIELGNLTNNLDISKALEVPPDKQIDTFEELSILGNRFELERKLGTGGSATTWLARDLMSDNRQVLLKVAKTTEEFSKLQAEFSLSQRATKGLPSSVRYSRAEQAIDKPDPGFLVFNYIEGVELRTIAKESTFTVQRAKNLFQKSLSALTFLHAEGFVHGDPTPRNLIIQDDDQVALIDFGNAVQVGEILRYATPRYAAPEIASKIPADQTTDLYTLAAGFLNLILGRPHANEDDGSPLLLSEVEQQQYGYEDSSFLEILFDCIKIRQIERPSTEDILLKLQRALPDLSLAPKFNFEYKINPTVAQLRQIYTGSELGASNAVAESVQENSIEFASLTYVPTKLDSNLLTRLLNGEISTLFLTGNPGDGKTTFLFKVRDELLSRGAQLVSSDGAGWEIAFNNRKYVSVLDASQSYDYKSADEISCQRLDLVLSENAIALFAINDGRLKQFFRDNFEKYPAWSDLVNSYFAGERIASEEFQVVDLKARTLVGFDDDGLLPQMLSQMTSKSLWEQCGSCAAVDSCPIYFNAQAISTYAKPTVNKLMLIGHLRRHRRATFRRVRSAIAWLITGDIDCKVVHSALQDTASNINLEKYQLQNLAFDLDSKEMLIHEFIELDPSQQISPALKSEILRTSNMTDQLTLSKTYRDTSRNIFFGVQTELNSDSILNETFVYRYFDVYIKVLQDPDSVAVKNRVLMGMSRIAGYFGNEINGLAIAESKKHSAWSIIKSIPLQDFRIEVPSTFSDYIETIPDALFLKHNSGATFIINLDAFELLCRAAEGEIFADVPSETIRFDILAFISHLIRVPVNSVSLVDPSGSSWAVRNDKGVIVRELTTESSR